MEVLDADTIGGLIILVLFLSVGLISIIIGLIYRVVMRWMDRRHEAARHRERLERQQEKRRAVEASNDAIKLLMTDESLAGDFNRRLRIAIEESEKKTGEAPAQKKQEDEEDDEALAEEEATQPRRAKSRKRR
jgi:flagellar biosynthesis/type III secretory pathway M-ring protein FliF/YscJ